jgi:hypothetical protein
MGMQLSYAAKTSLVITPTAGAAGTTDIEGTSVDMQGFEAVLFTVIMGAITANAVTALKVQQSDDDGAADAYSDLEGTSQTIGDGDDGEVFYVDVFRPSKRYVRLYIDRATQNAVVAAAIAQQYHCREQPVTHGTGVQGETHVSPAEGTA